MSILEIKSTTVTQLLQKVLPIAYAIKTRLVRVSQDIRSINKMHYTAKDDAVLKARKDQRVFLSGLLSRTNKLIYKLDFLKLENKSEENATEEEQEYFKIKKIYISL